MQWYERVTRLYIAKASESQGVSASTVSTVSTDKPKPLSELPHTLPFLEGGELFAYQREGLLWIRKKQVC